MMTYAIDFHGPFALFRGGDAPASSTTRTSPSSPGSGERPLRLSLERALGDWLRDNNANDFYEEGIRYAGTPLPPDTTIAVTSPDRIGWPDKRTHNNVRFIVTER